MALRGSQTLQAATKSFTSASPLRVGYVPEHYLLPFHLATAAPVPTEPIPFPSGTGHMISSLRADEIDIGIGLTEGWVAGLLSEQGQKAKGYAIVGSLVENPLRWAVVTGRKRGDISAMDELQQHRKLGVSRLGSGSHIMGFVLAQQQGWLTSGADSKSVLDVIPLGPFKDLRDGVTGHDETQDPTADFFMWEHFTTKPYFDSEGTPLKKIGEILTPWPSWHIAASTKSFPDPEADRNLAQFFDFLDRGVKSFQQDPDSALAKLSTGELGCHYSQEDAQAWFEAVKFFEKTRGVDTNIMSGVVDVLHKAGVVDSKVTIQAGDGVIGISRTHAI